MPDAVRLLTAWAEDAARFADVLALQDPSWGARHHPFAGGRLVLCGTGMYVNRALAAGITAPIRPADIEVADQWCRDVGVPLAVDVTRLTTGASRRALEAAGIRPEPSSATAFTWPVGAALPDAPDDIVIRSVSAAALGEWQAASAAGWGHETADARRVSDAFVRAAREVDGDGMVLALDAADGRTLGCASLTVNGGVATLGGMSTLPAERRRGVQAALVRHRLGVALAAGCDIIASSAVTGGASERNLGRLGFQPVLQVTTWRRGE